MFVLKMHCPKCVFIIQHRTSLDLDGRRNARSATTLLGPCPESNLGGRQWTSVFILWFCAALKYMPRCPLIPFTVLCNASLVMMFVLRRGVIVLILW